MALGAGRTGELEAEGFRIEAKATKPEEALPNRILWALRASCRPH